eukprot:CAMPEP_0181355878 /NCGR_PEP_ID=MMETSP1106-20121128/4132_1 /TAXON_ID=81844 /ORGANISM="Mantoniella antarctica, Strain SL-175" /LENGTH=66 /DNA_ID=CAMNT_0023468643 /DNA_START=173 /DNA_END=370 /DNA_ORIENTATION=+
MLECIDLPLDDASHPGRLQVSASPPSTFLGVDVAEWLVNTTQLLSMSRRPCPILGPASRGLLPTSS